MGCEERSQVFGLNFFSFHFLFRVLGNSFVVKDLFIKCEWIVALENTVTADM